MSSSDPTEPAAPPAPPATELQPEPAVSSSRLAESAPAVLPAHAAPVSFPSPSPLPSPIMARPSQPAGARPSFVFFGVVSAISLIADVTSKAWAEMTLSRRTMVDPAIVLIKDHLSLTLAYNRGGAWGLLQNASEMVRRPFFLAVSALAIAFIVSLYGRLGAGQRALKWGLPLVLGGALGNLSDRIIRSSVIDFIDFRANWIETMNLGIGKVARGWGITDHWPTFNVADVSICVGVGLMALDMFVSKRGPSRLSGQHLVHEPSLSAPASKPPTA